MFAVRKDVRLQRQERSARIHEVDTGQAVLLRDLLSAQMLLDGHRVVGAALDRGVVGDDHHLAAGNAPDARDEAGARRFSPVHAVRRQRRELEKGRSGIEQRVHPVADEHLLLLGMALSPRAPLACPRKLGLELRDQALHRERALAEIR